MHSRHRRTLTRRREQLLLRSAQLRRTLAQQSQPLQGTLALADQLRAGLHWLRRHPVWPVVVLAVLSLPPTRRLVQRLPRLLALSQLLLQIWQWLGRRSGRSA